MSLARPILTLFAILPLAGILLWPSRAQGPRALPRLPIATRGPSALAFTRDGKTLYVAEQDSGDVAVVNPDTGKVDARIGSGGKEPTGLALSPDGRTLAVANSFSGSIGIIDTESRKLRATVPLLGMPWEVVIAKDGIAFASVSQLDEVAVIDLAAGKVLQRIPTGLNPIRSSNLHWQPVSVNLGHRPRALALTPDGTTLLCANFGGATLSLIDTASRQEIGCVRMPAINMRGLAISPDGKRAFATGQTPETNFSTEKPEEMWSNAVHVVRLEGKTSWVEATLKLDQPGNGAADPYGITLDSQGDVLVTLGGAHELTVIPNPMEQAVKTYRPQHRRIPVGANPRAVAIRPGSGEVWVADHLSSTLVVLDSKVESVSRVVDLGSPDLPDIRLRGRFLFSSAHLSPTGSFTCNTCHPDGNTEGLSWRFHFLPKGIERRNSRNLRGGLLLTGPFGWEQREEDYEAFVNDEIEQLFRSRKLPHTTLHAFWDLVNAFDMPPNPYRAPDGSFTESALHGKALFEGMADCSRCHSGPRFGGNGKKEWVGTTEAGQKLDVPHLYGAYDSAPWLHDGRAATLNEIFDKYNPAGAHGHADKLTAPQLRDVIEYVREL